MSPAVNEDRWKEGRRRTQLLAWGGILTGLGWMFLIFARIIPMSSLSFRILAVFVLLAAELRLGQRGALMVFAATGLLGAGFPGFFNNLPYYFYLAPYLLLAFILTSQLSRHMSRFALTALRIAVGTLLFMLFAKFYGIAMFPEKYRDLLHKHYYLLVPLIGFIGTVVYDYVLGLLSVLYVQRLEPYFKSKE